MRVGIAGAQSTIAREFCRLLPRGVDTHCDRLNEMPESLDRYLICTGFLAGKAVTCITPEEAEATFRRNFVQPAAFCDRIFLQNPNARVCVIGSESGFSGSFDASYAAAKAGLHRYIESKALGPEQQLVGIAPSIVADTGMTIRRSDDANLERRRASQPKQRFLMSAEVAALAHFLLFVDRGYTTGTVVRMNGGQNAAQGR